ncbi:MAG: hypothetical protein OIF57_08710 [Marinobacterium sp.]|nr:hypothetical protein [Marinobacterium sp.]
MPEEIKFPNTEPQEYVFEVLFQGRPETVSMMALTADMVIHLWPRMSSPALSGGFYARADTLRGVDGKLFDQDSASPVDWFCALATFTDNPVKLIKGDIPDGVMSDPMGGAGNRTGLVLWDDDEGTSP